MVKLTLSLKFLCVPIILIRGVCLYLIAQGGAPEVHCGKTSTKRIGFGFGCIRAPSKSAITFSLSGFVCDQSIYKTIAHT